MKRIVRNITSLFIGRFISTILSVVLSIYIARILGDALFGRYSVVIAFVTMFAIFLDLGYETFLVREVAKDKSKASKYLNNIIGIRAVLSILIFILIVILLNIFNFPENIRNIIYLFSISQILVSLSNVFRVIFRAFERMDYEAGVNIFYDVFRSSLGILVIFLGYGLTELGFVFIFSSIVYFIISFLICEKKFVVIKPLFDFLFFKETVKTAFLIGLITIFGLIYVKIDTIMLALFKGEAVVGWYNAAYNLILGFRPLPNLFMHALLPFMSYTYVKSKNSLRNVYEKSFKFLIVIGLPISVGIFLLADRFIILIYGQTFVNSIVALRILSWDILLKFLYLCIWFVLLSADKQKKLVLIAGGGAILNIVLNLFLIPEYSLVGAAFATILTEIFILMFFLYLASVDNFIISFKSTIVKPVFSCIIMALFIYFFSDNNIYLVVLMSILIYFMTFIIIKGFSKEEIDIIKKLIKRS